MTSALPAALALSAAFLAVAPTASSAATPTTTTVVAHFATHPLSQRAWVEAHVAYADGACPTSPLLPAMNGTLTLKRDGVPVQTSGFYLSFYRECTNGVWGAGTDFTLEADQIRDYTYSVEYSGDGELLASASEPVVIHVVADATGPSPDGTGVIEAGSMTPPRTEWYCSSRALSVESSAGVAAPALRFPLGFIRYQHSSCFYMCGFLCPSGTPTIPQQVIRIESPSALAPTMQAWAYTTPSGQSAPSWQSVPVTVDPDGRGATLLVSGSGSQIVGIVGLAVPNALPQVQDMWWAGEAENGWGLSISQSGEHLFVGLYVYGDDGKPQWLVMTSGAWDPAHSTFSGDLYHPMGTWFGNYQASAFRPGSAVGTLSVTFDGDASGAIDYTIGGRSGHKAIKRLVFASQVQGAYAGLWWGGVGQNGWGVAIGHQGPAIFAIWYTYDTFGIPQWFMLSDGSWTAPDRYSGTLYRTHGSPWLGVAYDAGRFGATPIGSMSLTFSPDGARMDYTADGVSGTVGIVRQPF